MSWKNNWIVIDTETTGLRGRVVEIAILSYKNGIMTDMWSSVVRPEVPIGSVSVKPVDWNDRSVKEALSINMLSMDVILKAPMFCELIDEISRRVADADVIVAHNAPFDVWHLNYEFSILGMKNPIEEHDLVVADTLILDKHLNPKVNRKRKLAFVAKHYGINIHKTHEAEYDAMLCGDIFKAMLEHLPDDVDEFASLHDQLRNKLGSEHDRNY